MPLDPDVAAGRQATWIGQDRAAKVLVHLQPHPSTWRGRGVEAWDRGLLLEQCRYEAVGGEGATVGYLTYCSKTPTSTQRRIELESSTKHMGIGIHGFGNWTQLGQEDHEVIHVGYYPLGAWY